MRLCYVGENLRGRHIGTGRRELDTYGDLEQRLATIRAASHSLDLVVFAGCPGEHLPLLL